MRRDRIASNCSLPQRIVLFAAAVLLVGNSPVEQLGREKLPLCGEEQIPPYGRSSDAGVRACPPEVERSYRPRFDGIAYDVLRIESVACFVPDSHFRLLDAIVDEVLARMRAEASEVGESTSEKALRASDIFGKVLEEKGFGLWVPTQTLADALTNRARADEEPRYIFDCDTGSLILLTVAEQLRVPAALVEITLPSGNGHNYVRWQTGENEWLDWDTNGRGPCETPENLPAFEGRAMTRDETTSYVTFLRAGVWKRRGEFDRAVSDYRQAISLAPGRPLAMNNFAWLVSTTNFSGRDALRHEALQAAERAVALHRTPTYLDTLACAYALNGAFGKAIDAQAEALAGDPDNRDYLQRLEWFESRSRNCTGAT